MRLGLPLAAFILGGCASCNSVYAAPDAAQLFRSTVQPALKRHCNGCHGEGQTLSGLDLRSRDAALKGGKRGAALTPGDASRSLLYRAIRGEEIPMPPGEPAMRLSAEVVDAIGKWIDGGAVWPLDAPADRWASYKEEDLWAFRKLKRPAVLAPRGVDEFIDGKLAASGLMAAPRAGRRTLIRRAFIDLTGLPPAPEDVDAFVADKAPDAFAKLIERLLASPRYGEHWGRHWLDVARYADTAGYSNDFERPNAWRYRDYVIRSFNRDKPYDRFVREQIAGDELFPGDAEALIATGFLRSGPWEHTAMSVEAVTRQMFLDDVTHNTAAAFLGLTLGCARCHDHKFDPLPTRDYYRMQAVFATTEFARPRLPFLDVENTADLAAGRARLREITRRTQAGMDAFDQTIAQGLMKQHGVARAEDLPAGELAEAIKNKTGLTPEQFENFKLYQKHMQLYRESLDRYEPKAFAVSSGPLDGETDGGIALRYPKRAAYSPAEVHILPGGNLQSPAEAVKPGVLSLLQPYGDYPEPPIPETVAGRRAVLAKWIASPDNPLTARVMVNRIWQYHFGRGIAADANNFGKMGKKPSHPELLDWLAARFIESGWSVKAVHRLIMLSEAYQRASSHPRMEEARRRDPDNALLSFYSPRQVEAEVLRDSILAVAGELSTEAGGPGVFPQINEDVARQPRHTMGSVQPAYHASSEKRMRNRRTIYTFQQRSLIDPMIQVFNGPGLDLSCERRTNSIVPTQSFTLFNGQFMHDMALAMAARLEREAATTENRVKRAFLLAFGRPPEAREMRASLAHIARMTQHHRDAPPAPKAAPRPLVHTITSELTGEQFRFVQQEEPEPYEENPHPADVKPETRALADFALALLNANEFFYVD